MTQSAIDATPQLQALLADLAAEIGEAKKHPAAAGVPFASVDAAMQRVADAAEAASVTAGAIAALATDEVDPAPAQPTGRRRTE